MHLFFYLTVFFSYSHFSFLAWVHMVHSLSFLITGQIITISNLKRGKRNINKGNEFPWQPQPGEIILNILSVTVSLVLSREPESLLTPLWTECSWTDALQLLPQYWGCWFIIFRVCLDFVTKSNWYWPNWYQAFSGSASWLAYDSPAPSQGSTDEDKWQSLFF